MRTWLGQFLLPHPEGRLESLAHELKQFSGRMESQFIARVNLFHPAFKMALPWLGVPTESNYKGCTHNDVRV